MKIPQSGCKSHKTGHYNDAKTTIRVVNDDLLDLTASWKSELSSISCWICVYVFRWYWICDKLTGRFSSLISKNVEMYVEKCKLWVPPYSFHGRYDTDGKWSGFNWCIFGLLNWHTTKIGSLCRTRIPVLSKIYLVVLLRYMEFLRTCRGWR